MIRMTALLAASAAMIGMAQASTDLDFKGVVVGQNYTDMELQQQMGVECHSTTCMVTIANVYATYDADIRDGRLVTLKLTIDEPFFGRVLEAMSHKFGEPQVERSVLQNGFGAQFDQLRALWSDDDVRVTARRYTHDNRYSEVRFESRSYWDERAASQQNPLDDL